MGIKAALVSAGAMLEWIERFDPKKVEEKFGEKLRRTITALREYETVEVMVSSTDFAVAIAWYFSTGGWDVRFVYPDLLGLEPTQKKCLYIFIDAEQTDLPKEESKKLSSWLHRGSKALFLYWGKQDG